MAIIGLASSGVHRSRFIGAGIFYSTIGVSVSSDHFLYLIVVAALQNIAMPKGSRLGASPGDKLAPTPYEFIDCAILLANPV